MRAGSVLLVWGLTLSSALSGQSPLYPTATATGGLEIRAVTFTSGIRLESARQTALHLVGGVPIRRRLFVDVGTSYAVTRLRSVDGITVDLSGFTDTEVRGTLTIGANLAAVSLAIALPTGAEQVSSEQLPLLRSIAQDFLPFPVSSYGAGAGITAGVATAQQWGDWSVGGAASVRYVSVYSPFDDLDAEYDPGIEGRVRLGLRRSLGPRTQITAGLTASTFGTDAFSGAQSFTYRSGNRYAVELGVLRQLGTATLRAGGWAFLRASGDSSGVTVQRARERIAFGSTMLTVPLSSVALDGSLDIRHWSTADGAAGSLFGLGVTARVGVSREVALAPSLRYERGDVAVAQGVAADFRGFAFSVYLRVGR